MFAKNLRMKQIQMTGMALFLSILVVACGSQPSEQPITNTTWLWAELVETEPASQSIVPDPENYTLLLQADGSVSVQADCNMVSGSYDLADNNLTIEFGPSTMAFCSETSLDQLYLEMLSNVESYVLQDGRLVLELRDNAGQMTFNEG